MSADDLEDLGGPEPLFDTVDDRQMARRISAALRSLAQKEGNLDRNARLNLMAGWLLGLSTRLHGLPVTVADNVGGCPHGELEPMRCPICREKS